VDNYEKDRSRRERQEGELLLIDSMEKPKEKIHGYNIT